MLEKTTVSQNRTAVGFEATVWTVVLNSGNPEALEQLCQTYWPPIYAFLRRSGHQTENAQDLTQGFFIHLLAGERLKNVHPAKGKFRSFLLACLNNYVRNEWDKERSQKRGGGGPGISIDLSDAEQRYGVAPVDTQDPARIFEQRWARVLLTQVLEQVKASCANNGKAELFATLQPHLTGDSGRGGYAEAAAKLQMSEGAVRVAASRLRDEFRARLRAEVGKTVASPAEIDDEIRQLFAAFRTA